MFHGRRAASGDGRPLMSQSIWQSKAYLETKSVCSFTAHLYLSNLHIAYGNKILGAFLCLQTWFWRPGPNAVFTPIPSSPYIYLNHKPAPISDLPHLHIDDGPRHLHVGPSAFVPSQCTPPRPVWPGPRDSTSACPPVPGHTLSHPSAPR